MLCPRCKREIPEGPECPACGVVFSKYRARPVAPAGPARPPPQSQREAAPAAVSPLGGRAAFFAVSARRLAALYGELSRLLEAGIPPASAFSLLEKHSHGRIRRAAIEARKRIDSGSQLWEALAASPDVFPPRAVALIAAAEQTGGVPAALGALSASEELKLQLRQRVVRACVYPFILFSLSFFLLPLSVLVTKGLSAYLGEALGPYLTALAALFFLFGLLPRLLEMILGRPAMQRAGLALPIIGPMRQLRHRAEFCGQFSSALAAGLDMAAALRLAALASGQHQLAESAEKAIEHMGRGDTLSEALRAAGFSDDEFLLSVSAGEASGHLPEALGQQARLSQQVYLHRIEMAVQLFSVLLLLLVYAFVALRVVAQYRDIVQGYQGQMDQLLKEMGGGDLEKALRGGGLGRDLPPELRGIFP